MKAGLDKHLPCTINCTINYTLSPWHTRLPPIPFTRISKDLSYTVWPSQLTQLIQTSLGVVRLLYRPTVQPYQPQRQRCEEGEETSTHSTHYQHAPQTQPSRSKPGGPTGEQRHPTRSWGPVAPVWSHSIPRWIPACVKHHISLNNCSLAKLYNYIILAYNLPIAQWYADYSSNIQ